MKNPISLTLAVLAGVGGFLTAGTSPATAASSTAQRSAAIECHEASATLTVQHRAPVHSEPSGTSSVVWIAAEGKTYRIGGYCDNDAGNRWYCVAGCDFSDAPRGFWIWEEYFLA